MTSTAEIVVDKNIAFTSGERPLLWDIYRSASHNEIAPVVLVLHGGGWRGGHREMMEAACTAFARQGYVAIAPEYRLLGEVQWPVPLNDLRTAVRAVRAKAKALRIDPERLFLTGYSAGAHLALLAAGMKGPALQATDPYSEQSEAVAGIAAFFPPARIAGQFAALLGVAEDGLDAVSPQTYAATLPPTIIFCGDEDSITPPQLSLDLHKAIRAAGGACDLRLFSHLVHEFVSLPGMMETTVRDALEFFDRTVISKGSFDQALAELHAWWKARMRQMPPSAPAPAPAQGEMIGVGYVRIPAPQLEPQLDFYTKTFGMQQIGCMLEHGLILNVGRTPAEATANKHVRVILDNRLTPVDQNPVAFIVRSIGRVVERAKDYGATITMEPLVARNGNIVAKLVDPTGNRIELIEEGSDKDENLYLIGKG